MDLAVYCTGSYDNMGVPQLAMDRQRPNKGREKVDKFFKMKELAILTLHVHFENHVCAKCLCGMEKIACTAISLVYDTRVVQSERLGDFFFWLLT